MNRFAAIIFAYFVVLFPNTLLAGTDYYVCKLEEVAASFFDAENVNKFDLAKFSKTDLIVNRDTGEVKHEWLWNAWYDETTVLFRGNDSNSFKVVSSNYSGEDGFYMIVNEYAASKNKPFVLVTNYSVWLGTCE